ncbi:MAG TPA: PIN domain nuclease, partial [Acidobacteriota bacterium]|nr:PIN domain nuclease [Acidobacteriota bacterium]
MDLFLIRALLFAAILLTGYFVRPFDLDLIYTTIICAVFGFVVILAEIRIRRLSIKTLLGAAVGSILGIIGASLISLIISRMNLLTPQAETFVQILVLMLMAYIGLVAGANKGEALNLASFGG